MKRCRACPTLLPSQMSFPNWKQSNAAAKSQFETVTIVTFEEDSIDELSGDEQNLLETAFCGCLQRSKCIQQTYMRLIDPSSAPFPSGFPTLSAKPSARPSIKNVPRTKPIAFQDLQYGADRKLLPKFKTDGDSVD
jgi:hypothetical protein